MNSNDKLILLIEKCQNNNALEEIKDGYFSEVVTIPKTKTNDDMFEIILSSAEYKQLIIDLIFDEFVKATLKGWLDKAYTETEDKV